MATITKRESSKSGKKNNQWQVKIRRAGYPSVSETFQTNKEAKIWAREIELEMDRGTFISRAEAEATTLKQALERYLAEITPSKKGSKAESNRINIWMKHSLARRPLTKIHGVDMAKYRDQRIQDEKSPSTVRNELSIISHVYNIAKTEWGMEGLINPIEHVRMPKQHKGRDRRLEGDEEKRLIESASTPLKEMIILAIETGMRMGEQLSMIWDMVDLKNRIVKLEDTKNGECRDIPLSSKAVKVLKGIPRNIDGRVIPKISSSHISHNFGALCKNLEIENLRFHDLRHEATSRFFEKGFNPMEVSAITGHKTLHMLKRYTHLKAEDLAKRLG